MRCGAKVFPIVIVMVFIAFGRAGHAEDYHVIPFDVDPPIVIDGNLDDWAGVPNPVVLERKEQVTFGAEKWTGPDDLSATFRLAWRHDGLYVAADVTDDVICQPLIGRGMYRADHIEFFMDMKPGVEPRKTMFGKGQFQFGLSPGNLGQEAGAELTPPEIVVWRPAGAQEKGGRIVAKKTDKGYLIEAYVPFSCLMVSNVRMHQDANFEIVVSDTDARPPTQETLITRMTEKWAYSRKRLSPVVFGDGNGKGRAPVRAVKIKDKLEVEERKTQTVTFAAPAVAKEKDPFIFFQARFHRKKVSGWWATCMAVELNGKRIRGDRISNRPNRSMTMGGNEATFIAPDGRMTIAYTPSGRAFDRNTYYGLIDRVKGCEFEFNVAGLLRKGENVLLFRSFVPPHAKSRYIITVEDIEFRIRAKAPPKAALRPAPTGPLPIIEPQKTFPKTYSRLRQRNEVAMIGFRLNGESFAALSRFSAPDGRWHIGSTKFYEHTRKVVAHNEWIEVRDTFKNLAGENVPIIQEHTCTLGEKRTNGVWLSCVKIPAGRGRKSVPSNPSVFAVTTKSGIGMVVLNDVFRVHVVQNAAGGAVTLADRSFVLKAGGEYTAEWAIVPTRKPDMWAFVNAARRLMDANFTLPIQFAFLTGSTTPYKWTDTALKNFIERKNADFICQSIGRYKGRWAHGTAFLKIPKTYKVYAKLQERLDKLFPDGRVRRGVYYHCFIDAVDETAKLYPDARRIDAAGKHMYYSGKSPWSFLYVPTLTNGFGKAVAKGIDVRLDTLGDTAFYWDEYNSSRGQYTYNKWDGCSADIDPRTFKIKRLKGAVHLLSLEFLHHHIKRIMDRGIPFVGNGAPYSRTLAKLKFQNFVETGSISNCYRTLLHSPVALGDHLTERSQKDAYDVMLRALDWGCLYNWYSQLVIPTHKTITEHMFPFTPIELHSGYVIGKERILTNRSGLFGWGDNSAFTCYVYDRLGRITDGKEAKRVTRNGKTYAEVRIPEGYSAAIVRK